MTDLRKPMLLFVVGATATGKSDLAVAICERSQPAEILNSDSVQFFQDVEIGSAKPEPALLARAKHHLVSHVPAGASYAAGEFRNDAVRIIDDAQASRGVNRLIVVGGSGFYVQALEKGMYDVPDISDETKRALLHEIAEPEGAARLYIELRQRDAVAAAKIQPADRYRILRALEILRSDSLGRTLTQIREHFAAQQPEIPFAVSKLGLMRSRDELRQRVIARTHAMLAAGLIDEVRALRERGLRDWQPLKSVGYREVQLLLDGELSADQLKEAIVTSTMQLAKRQMTWFKRDPEIRWFDASSTAAFASAVAYGVEALAKRP